MPKATKKEIVTAFRTQEILAAARTLLRPAGSEAITMEEIAAAAGVAKGTLYLYFQSKDSLIQAMITQVGENILQDVESPLQAPGTPPRKIDPHGVGPPGIPQSGAAAVSLLRPGIAQGETGLGRGSGATTTGNRRAIFKSGDGSLLPKALPPASLFRPTPAS